MPRKRLPEEEARSITVRARVTPHEAVVLAAVMAKRGMTQGEAVRAGLDLLSDEVGVFPKDLAAAPPGAVARRPKAVTQSAAPQPDRPTVDPPKVGGDPVVPTCQHVYIRQGGVRVCKRCGKEYTG